MSECVPVLKPELVKVAEPVESNGDEIVCVPLSVRTTVPVGTPEVEGVTMAVMVTDCPGADGSTEEAMDVVVASIATVCAIADEVLVSKFESP